jgi:hypothetical protein
MTKLNQEDPYLSAMMAKCKSLCESLDDLALSIHRLNGDGVCSDEVARAARKEVDGCRDGLGILFGKTLLLHLGLRDIGSSTKLLTQGEILPILNELGYPVTALKRMLARNEGPPLANSNGFVKIDWDSFTPDPRNGEVYVTEYYEEETPYTPSGFAVLHNLHSRDSACGYFKTLAEARAAAERIARERNAVFYD